MSGTVSVDDAGAVTGTGDALALYNQIETIQVADNPLPDPTTPDDDWDQGAEAWSRMILPMVVKMKRAWAREALAHANIFRGDGPRIVESLAATADIGLTSEIVVSPTRAAPTTLTLPASAPVGHLVEVIEVGNDAAHALTVAAPGGESLAGLTAVGVLLRRTYIKWDATNWIGVA